MICIAAVLLACATHPLSQGRAGGSLKALLTSMETAVNTNDSSPHVMPPVEGRRDGGNDKDISVRALALLVISDVPSTAISG